MIRYLVAAALAFASPALSQPAEWRHAESGVSIAREIGDLRVGQEREFGGAGRYDVFVQLGSDREPATLYVYRAAYPNPALWFDRVRTAMNANVGSESVGAAPRAITLGNAPAPNALREEFDLPAGGQWRATSVTIIQAGEWIVKLRVTSATLDRAGVAVRMDRLLEALRFARALPAPHPLRVPAACDANLPLNGDPVREPRAEGRAAARVTGGLVFAEARGQGGLAADSAAWCRAATDIPPQYGTAYRRRDGREWVVLVSDSGRAVSARQLEGRAPGLPEGAAASFANLPQATRIVFLYDGLPDIGRAFMDAVPVASGQAAGIAEISAGPERD